MKRLFYIFLISLYVSFSYSQTKECFSMKCIEANVNLDSIYLVYEVRNNTSSDIYLLKTKYDGLRNHCWRIAIKDSLNNWFEPTFTTCGYSGDELENYMLIRKDSAFQVKFKINVYEIEIPGQSKFEKEFKPVGGFNFPLKIILHYSCNGLYLKNNRYKKLLNAEFNCQSEPFYLK